MKVSLQFIADEAKVSKSLVSKVLNGREVRVSGETRQRILDIARQYNYVPNRMAMNLRTQTTHTIALIVPNITFDFFSKLCYAIESKAGQMGYNVIICNTLEDVKKEKQHLDLCRMGIVDGIIICPTGEKENMSQFKHLKEQNFPIVYVDRYLKEVDLPAVVTNNKEASKILTDRFIEEGLKEITFINRRRGTSDQEERYDGYKQAMEEQGLDTKRCYLYNDQGINHKVLEELTKNLPEAIIMSTSWDMIKLLEVFKPKGICVPQHVKIGAFDSFYLPYGNKEEIALASCITEPLLLMEQNPYEMGNKAMELLLRAIHKEEIIEKRVTISSHIRGGV